MNRSESQGLGETGRSAGDPVWAGRVGRLANWPIRLKLTAGAFLIAVLTATVLTLVTSISALVALTEASGRNLENRAVAEGEHIGDVLTQQLNMVRSLTLNPAIVEFLAEKNAAYLVLSPTDAGPGNEETIRERLREEDKRWMELSDDDPQVQGLFRTAPTSELSKFWMRFGTAARIELSDHYGAIVGAVNGRPEHYYAGDEEWWQTARRDGIYISQPFRDPVSGEWVIGLAASVIDSSSGRFDGVLHVLNGFSQIEELLSSPQRTRPAAERLATTRATLVQVQGVPSEDLGTGLRQDFPRPGSGQAGQALDTSPFGGRGKGPIVIADPDPTYRGQELDAFFHEPVAAVAQHPMHSMPGTDRSSWASGRFRGRSSILGIASVYSRDKWPAINNLGWVVVIYQDRLQALIPVFMNATWLGGLVWLISTLGVTLLSFYAAGLLTRPLVEVAEAAERIRAGDLEVVVPVHFEDETGVLARAFNAMTEQVRELIHTLEMRVEERTAEVMQRSTQLQALIEVGRVAISTLDPDELLQQTVDSICERFGYYHVCVFLLDSTGRQVELRAASGETGLQLMREKPRLEVGEHSMIGWTAAHREARIAQDAIADTIRTDHPLLPETRSEIAVPLLAAKRLLGVLDVQSAQKNAFSQEDITTLQGVADQLAIALENARLFQETQKTLGKAEVLYGASRRLTTATSTQEVAQAIVECVAETGADGCVVIQFDSFSWASTGRPRPQDRLSAEGNPETLVYLGAWRRDRAPTFQTGLRLPITESVFPLDMIGTLWAIPDVDKDESLPSKVRELFEETEVKAIVNIPLNTKERVIGQVVVIRTTPGPFSDTARRLYEMLSDQAAVALERALLLEETQRRAEREQLVSEIAARVRAGYTLEQVLNTTVQEVCQTLGAARVAVQLSPSAGLPHPGRNSRTSFRDRASSSSEEGAGGRSGRL